MLDLEVINEALIQEIKALKAELTEVQYLEASKNLLELENTELKHKISELQIQNVSLKDNMDGMSDDMGLLEARILELTRPNDND